MNGIVGSAPDIHSQTGSASDASIADANTRSSRVGEPGAYRFNAISANATAAASITALPRVADPGLGTLTSAYHSSSGCIDADSNRSAIRFDLSGAWNAGGRWLLRSSQSSHEVNNFREPIAVSMPTLCNFAMPRCCNAGPVFVAREIAANPGNEFIR